MFCNHTRVYSYGFNGKEKDDEIAGNGNINTAEFWEYDTRLGRRWNIDPIVKIWESPYASFRNNPIYYVDPYGLDGKEPKGKKQCADCGNNNISISNPTGKKPDKSEKPVEPLLYIPPIPIVYPDNNLPEPNLDNLTLKTPNTPQSYQPTIMEVVANKLRRMDHFFDHSNMEYSRPPVPTTFWGFMSFGSGGSKNVHMVSPHASNWADGNPGSLLYSLGKTSVNFTYTGPTIEFTEGIGKQSDFIGAFQYFIDGSGFDPFNQNTSETTGPKLRVIHDSELFWHIETSATGIEFLVETWQAKGDSGKAENSRKAYRSVHKKTRRN